MEIVPADREKISRLTSLARKTFRQTFRPLAHECLVQTYIDRHLNRREIAKRLGESGYIAFLALQEGRPIGYAALCRSGTPASIGRCNAVELQRIYLLSPWQGCGLGGELLNFCLSKAVNMGHNALWASCWEKNEKALGFFRHNGFDEIMTRDYDVGGIIHADMVLCRYLR